MRIKKHLGKLTLASCLILVGCATQTGSIGGDVQYHLMQVKIGYTMMQVRNLLGTPAAVQVSHTTSGQQDEWFYSDRDIAMNVTKPGASMWYSFSKGMAGEQDKHYHLYFENDALVKTEGF